MFDNIRDLLQGSITSPLNEIQDAYLHFKQMKDIRIIKVDEQLESRRIIIVNFVFQEKIIGEIEFRYKKYSPA